MAGFRGGVRWGVLVLALGVCAGCPDDGGDAGGDAGGDGGGDGGSGSDAEWQMVAEDLDPALLSVWGTSANDVWIVGADEGSGLGPVLTHFDGTAWSRLDTGADGGALWWVSGIGDVVWMVGETGLIVRYTRSTGQFETFTPPSAENLFGIEAFAPDDAWAVGGDVSSGAGVIWHFDGTAWTAAAGVPETALSSTIFFKVWGRSSEDLWVVGFGPTALHRSGDTWSEVALPQERRLFTVHGSDDLVVAVGGFVSGFLVETTTTELSEVTPQGIEQLNGVHVNSDGSAVAAGIEGTLWQRSTGGDWTAMPDVPLTIRDYHAVWVDPTGGIWAVGGFVVSNPLSDGMLAHYGEEPLTATDVLRNPE